MVRLARLTPLPLPLPSVLLTAAVAVVLFTALVPAGPAAAASSTCRDAELPASVDARRAQAAVLCLLNVERARRDLAPLRADGALARAARGHSADMVARRFFAHTTPSKVSFAERIRRTAYDRARRAKLGENLAWGMGEPALPAIVVSGWMESPPHRANILDPAFRAIGIGIARGVPVATASAAAADGVTYTTDFGSR